MSEPATPDVKQARMTEFMRLLPLTLELAGLPRVTGTLYTADQMEARVMSIRTAYKLARNLLKEVGEGV
ncbi:MAG: hypothetical protein K2X82_33145 [Gemmataceae bacterium]|nr:hypothetical protein [Gemmataceae bacterium]